MLNYSRIMYVQKLHLHFQTAEEENEQSKNNVNVISDEDDDEQVTPLAYANALHASAVLAAI